MAKLDFTEINDEMERILGDAQTLIEKVKAMNQSDTKLLPILQGPYKWGNSSRKKLEGHYASTADSSQPAHPDLVKIVSRALSYGLMNMSVICVYRGKSEQNQAFIAEKSEKQFPDSIHNNIDEDGFVCAIDVAPYVNGKVCWNRGQCCIMVGLCLAAGKELLASGEVTHEVRSGANWDMDGEFLTDQKLDDIVHLELVKKD